MSDPMTALRDIIGEMKRAADDAEECNDLEAAYDLRRRADQIDMALHDLAERLDKVELALKPILSIDLSKVSPTPWKSMSETQEVGESGEYIGLCYIEDARENFILSGNDDQVDEHLVEIGGIDHDANCVAAVDCVNAIAKLQEEFGKLKGDSNGPGEPSTAAGT